MATTKRAAQTTMGPAIGYPCPDVASVLHMSTVTLFACEALDRQGFPVRIVVVTVNRRGPSGLPDPSWAIVAYGRRGGRAVKSFIHTPQKSPEAARAKVWGLALGDPWTCD